MTRVIDERSNNLLSVLSDRSEDITRVIDERSNSLLSVLSDKSADMTRVIDQKSNNLLSILSNKSDDMTRVLDDRSSHLLSALSGKSQEFAGEVSRITDQTVKSIEAKGFVFTKTMMDNSEEIARLINDAGQSATATVTRTLGQLQEGAQGVTSAAKATISRTLEDLHSATKAAVDESKQTAAATVADMLETHGMLRNDSTALFERLREANILLQEVLSGAHENMNSIEHTMGSRISEFVGAMTDLSTKTGVATAKVEEHLGTFNTATSKVLHDLGDLAGQFTTHGRSLAEAVELLQKGNIRTEESIANRHASIDTLVSTLDARTDDFEQRLRRFSSLLEESLELGKHAGQGDRQHHRGHQQRQRPYDRTAIRSGAYSVRGRTQAHQRCPQRGL